MCPVAVRVGGRSWRTPASRPHQRHAPPISDMAGSILHENLDALSRTGSRPLEAWLASSEADGELEYQDGAVVGVLLRNARALVRLHSRRDPVAEADRLLGPMTANDLVIVVGGGAGFVLDALERRNTASRVLVLEPSAASLRAALSRRSWKAQIESGRLRLLAGPTYHGWTDLASWVGAAAWSPLLVVHPVIGRERPDDVERAADVVKRLLFNASANESARRAFAGPYLLNTLTNLRRLLTSRDVGELYGRFGGAPVFVLAAGPSLDRNLVDLKANRDGALVIAVDTALRPCLAAGVEPDLVVAVDPGEVNLRHLAVGTAPLRTHLVAEPSLAPGSFDAFADRVFTFRVDRHHPWPWLQEQGLDRSRLLAWGSVLTTALDLAVKLGCDPIVLLGADFAYTDGQPYCRGTAFEEDWEEAVAAGMPLKDVWRTWMRLPVVRERGIDGRDVETSPHLLAFRDWVAAFCGRQAGTRFVNGTGRGLLELGGTPAPGFGVVGRHHELGVATRLRPVSRPEVPGDTRSLLCEVPGAVPQAPWQEWIRTLELPTGDVARLLAGADRGGACRLLRSFAEWRARPWAASAVPTESSGDAGPHSEPLPAIARETPIPPRLEVFRSEAWQRINRRRLEHLTSLALPIAGRRVLEIGSGIGDLTEYFLDLGCCVTSVDGRGEFLQIQERRYGGCARFRAVEADLDPPPDRLIDDFDVVVCLGSLYVVRDAAALLSWAASCCVDLLVLETLLFPSTEPFIVEEAADPSLATGPLHGVGCRPSRGWVWQRLRAHFPFVYAPLTQPCHEQFPLDWNTPADRSMRAVFVAARRPVHSRVLSADLPERQWRLGDESAPCAV